MNTKSDTKQITCLAYVVEGIEDQHELPATAADTTADILARIKERHADAEITELLIEDEDEAVAADDRIVERVDREFKLVHASRGGKIKVVIHYEHEKRDRAFGPNATVRRIRRWAVSDKGFDLTEPAAKFVLKLGERVLEPELHLGQISRGERTVELTLVHGRKIQG